jgi:hypothetical protein
MNSLLSLKGKMVRVSQTKSAYRQAGFQSRLLLVPKSKNAHRILNPLLMLVSVIVMIGITALTIELLYQAFTFIETTLRGSSGQASNYFTRLAGVN